MAKSNKQLMVEARQSLKNNWNNAVGTNFIFGLIGIIGSDFSLIIGGPMQTGLSTFSLSIARNKKAELKQLFEGFNNFANSLVAYLLMTLYVVLWALLLIIPGIIAAIAYSQTFYILAEDKNISGPDALRKSKKMMDGKKGKYLGLCLRFTGWFLLSILTLGIGFLWLMPYANVSFAKFYEDVK